MQAEPRASARIGFVIGQLSVGGAEGQLCELLRHLTARFTPAVYCLAEQAGRVGDDLQRLGVPVHTVGQRGLHRAWRLRQLIQEHRIDLVHSWLFIANGYAAAATMLGHAQPLVTSARNCKIQGRVSQLVNAIAFRGSDAIVVNSRDVADYIRRHYLAPRSRVHVIVNGVDTERFHPAPAPVNSTGPCIVTIGRMVQQKNQALFLQAAAEVARVLPDSRFLIVGEGPLRGDLERQIAILGLGERVVLAGERRDTDAILRQASLFWLTSRWEGMPNTVLEALASGVPAIATEVGGTGEIIRHGVDGFLVPSGDVGGLVRHSVDLLQNPQRRQQLAANARERAEVFSPKRMAETFEALYDSILDGRQP